MNEKWVVIALASFAFAAALDYVAMRRVGNLRKWGSAWLGIGSRQRAKEYINACAQQGWSPWVVYSSRILFFLGFVCLLLPMPSIH
jgi:hypothetical protein